MAFVIISFQVILTKTFDDLIVQYTILNNI